MKTPDLQLCCVIGNPIEHSLSPLLHSTGYRALGLSEQFGFIRANVTPDLLESFVSSCRAMQMKGVSVTLPHKQNIIQYLDVLSEDAQALGAVNTIINQDGVLHGENTDWYGIVGPLEARLPLQDVPILVVGAGGAARAAIYGLKKRGARVAIANRTIQNAKKLAEEFDLFECTSLKDAQFSKYRILVNATSVGMSPQIDELPFVATELKPDQIVFDTVYNPLETKLLWSAKEQGATPISGVEMFIEQGARQFELYTGHQAPLAEMRRAILEEL